MLAVFYFDKLMGHLLPQEWRGGDFVIRHWLWQPSTIPLGAGHRLFIRIEDLNPVLQLRFIP